MSDDTGDILVWGTRDGLGFYMVATSGGGTVGSGENHEEEMMPDRGDQGQPPAITKAPVTAKCSSKANMAKKIGDAIKLDPSSREHEWNGAVVKEADGRFAASGGSIFTTFTRGSTAYETAGVDIPSIAGLVHNHPAVYPGADPAIDRYPSDRDWGALEQLERMNRGFDLANSMLYIVGPDGEVRAFPYSQKGRIPSQTNASARYAGEQLPDPLPPATGCEG